jgi:hypothetical protein
MEGWNGEDLGGSGCSLFENENSCKNTKELITQSPTKYCHVTEWLLTGFGLKIGFTEHLQNVNTNIYGSLTELHTPKITVTTAHIEVSQFPMSSVVPWWWIPTMSSASVITLLLAADCLQTNSLLQLSTLNWNLSTQSESALQPIISSWRQSLETHDQKISFNWTLAVIVLT